MNTARFLEVWCSERCSSKPRMPRAKRVAILKLEPRHGPQQKVAITQIPTCDADILLQNAMRHVNNTKGCQKDLHLASVSAEKSSILRPVLPVLKSHVTDWWKPLAGPGRPAARPNWLKSFWVVRHLHNPNWLKSFRVVRHGRQIHSAPIE